MYIFSARVRDFKANGSWRCFETRDKREKENVQSVGSARAFCRRERSFPPASPSRTHTLIHHHLSLQMNTTLGWVYSELCYVTSSSRLGLVSTVNKKPTSYFVRQETTFVCELDRCSAGRQGNKNKRHAVVFLQENTLCKRNAIKEANDIFCWCCPACSVAAPQVVFTKSCHRRNCSPCDLNTYLCILWPHVCGSKEKIAVQIYI